MIAIAFTEARLLVNRLRILRGQRKMRNVSIEAGSLAVSDGVQFDDAPTNAFCQQGILVLTAIHQATAQADEYSRKIAQLDKQSERAKIKELHQQLDRIVDAAKQKRLELAVVQQELGEKIIGAGTPGDRFVEYVRRHKAAEQNVRGARETVEVLATKKSELETTIGLRFRTLAAITLVGLALLAWLLRPSASAHHSFSGTARAATADDVTQQASATSPNGLSHDQLALCSQYVELHWTTQRPVTDSSDSQQPPTVQSGCSGSTGVVAYDSNTVTLVTNRHILDLLAIVQTRTTTATITQYDMTVIFPTKKMRTVRSIGHQVGDPRLDLVLLKVDRGDLQPDVDFVVLPLMKDGQYQTGDEVVAVGNPGAGDPNAGVNITLVGTQTFGHISAFREFDGGDMQQNFPGRWIQIDAALNHGNSGGPLLDKHEGHYFWIGISTAGFGDSGQQGLNLALDAQQVFSSKFAWLAATPEGISKAIRDVYNTEW